MNIDWNILKSAFPTGSLATAGSIGDIINILFPFIFAIAGLLLFVFLIMGGFQLMTAGGTPEKIKAGQGKITAAFIGFLIIFSAYWIIQILEKVFGISILS